MYIGQILKILVLIVSIFAGSVFIMPNVSSAEDVWCYSDGEFYFYLDSDTIKEIENDPNGIRYGVFEKMVYNNKMHTFHSYGFAVFNDNLVCYSYNRFNGKWEYPCPIKEDSHLRAIWQAMKPYMKKKGIYHSDSWE